MESKYFNYFITSNHKIASSQTTRKLFFTSSRSLVSWHEKLPTLRFFRAVGNLGYFDTGQPEPVALETRKQENTFGVAIPHLREQTSKRRKMEGSNSPSARGWKNSHVQGRRWNTHSLFFFWNYFL